MEVIHFFGFRDKFRLISASGWRDTVNVTTSEGTITKIAGGNVHNTGGGFYNIQKPSSPFRLQFKVPQNNAFLFIGMVF